MQQQRKPRVKSRRTCDSSYGEEHGHDGQHGPTPRNEASENADAFLKKVKEVISQ